MDDSQQMESHKSPWFIRDFPCFGYELNPSSWLPGGRPGLSLPRFPSPPSPSKVSANLPPKSW